MTAEQIKEHLSFEDIADTADIDLLGDGEERPFRCPSRDDHSSDDRTPSASANVTKGLWNCHGCGNSGDAIDLYRIARGVDFAKAIAELELLVRERLSESTEPRSVKPRDRRAAATIEPVNEEPLPGVGVHWERALASASEEVKAGLGPGLDYLSSRLDNDAARFCFEHNLVGVDTVKSLAHPALAVPLYDAAGRICDIQYRSCQKSAVRRVKGAGQGRVLFFGGPAEIRRAGDGDLLIAEGLLDYLGLRALGHPTIGLPGAGRATKVARVVRQLLEADSITNEPAEPIEVGAPS